MMALKTTPVGHGSLRPKCCLQLHQ